MKKNVRNIVMGDILPRINLWASSDNKMVVQLSHIVPASTTSLATDCSVVEAIVSTGVEISASPAVSLI